MQPTYSFSEIKSLIRSLDFSSVHILQDLIDEEKECFTPVEIKALEKFMQLKNKAFVQNEVKIEYLLSFN